MNMQGAGERKWRERKWKEAKQSKAKKKVHFKFSLVHF